MDLWVSRNSDGAKCPDWYKSMGLGGDFPYFRCRVKVEIPIQETRMRLEARASYPIAPKMRVFTQSLIRHIVGGEAKAVNLDENMVRRIICWF